MQKGKKNLEDGNKYDVAIVKLIRNNGIVINREKMIGGSTFFMLDYFDLLCCKCLHGDDKVYRMFWNFHDDYTKDDLNYKVAYKTLSIYAEKSEESNDIFRVDDHLGTLSDKPFLGIIQINYVYDDRTAIDFGEALALCEKKIKEFLSENGFEQSEKLRYKIYRSSTSGDFCMVVRASMIQDIFNISVILNSIFVIQEDNKYEFDTYTNVGIECPVGSTGDALSFAEETLQSNKDCRFVLRFTTDCDFAREINEKIAYMKIKTVEPAAGLFGRYDYMARLSMDEFAEIYQALCRTKIIVSEEKEPECNYSIDKKQMSLTELLSWGIRSRRIKIINERALVELAENKLKLNAIPGVEIKAADKDLGNNMGKAKDIHAKFGDDLEKFRELRRFFFEESRPFNDINRALGEMISTYVPQGVENDSYVNWQLLISDLKVIFGYARAWKESYIDLRDESVRRKKRLHFLQDMRAVIDAVNQYYKFLQNVNMHTWQSPLYEIQTQLDAEKMMIAYREFLYDYLKKYKRYFMEQKEEPNDVQRPMFYPIVYPDLSIDQACAMVVSHEKRNLNDDYRLLICRVPSFEYYGRVFNMIPWTLHEASHSVRVVPRKERNDYLFTFVMKDVFSQAMLCLINQFSNDYGYCGLGKLEKDIVEEIVNALKKKFESEFEMHCSSGESDSERTIYSLEFNQLETEMMEFLFRFFDRSGMAFEENVNGKGIKSVQAGLLRFLGELNLLEEEIPIEGGRLRTTDAVADGIANSDIFYKLLEMIYNAYYKDITEQKPEGQEWMILLKNRSDLEECLYQNAKQMKIVEKHRKGYFFKMQELNRIYGAWSRGLKRDNDEDIRSAILKECIPAIREKISIAFNENRGCAELYRILNMVFGYGETVDEKQVARVGNDFNVFTQEQVYELVKRAVTIYRETCADLYMAMALGLEAFGYCRQIVQTISDISTLKDLEDIEDSNSVNINRFRMVTAVLLKAQCTEAEKKETYVKIAAAELFEKGKQYCKKNLECAERTIQKGISRYEGNDQEKKGKEEAVRIVYDYLNASIEDIFKAFEDHNFYREKLEDSMLGIYLSPDRIDYIEGEADENAKENLKQALKCVESELNSQLHIIYRIQYFIIALDLISTEGNIVVSTDELLYFQGVRQKQEKIYQKQKEEDPNPSIRDTEICRKVSAYYNDPDSAIDKTHASMLEDTLEFIQEYYYRNRSKVMASIRKKEGKTIG